MTVPTANLLGDQTSPYLRQHKDNPVHWRPWSAGALARARSEDKPILLSIGYAACHWCHVMADESFEDQATAGLMNELFVNIKVDREERPDLDAIYQGALALLGEQGGWPLTMFLTPDGEPFWGGTYFPPTPAFGRPGFAQVLRAISEAWQNRRGSVIHDAAQLRQALTRPSRPEGAGAPDAELVVRTVELALGLVDSVAGGTSGAPKFPQPTFFAFLWRAYRRSGSEAARDAVTLTLDRICQGGIYDHLGGGFARYATDPMWLVPHFEKMLYDNALLVELLGEVWKTTHSPLYATRVAETVQWLLDDMRTVGGAGFVSAYDADSEGVEGKYYVWTADEIDSVLGADAEAFKRAYGVTPGGNWEGRSILNRGDAPEFGDPDHEAALAEGRARLLAIRRSRVAPGRDDKVLADWNGLAIAAVAGAGVLFERPEWLAAARDAFDFVCRRMADGDRLRHAWCAGVASHPAVLDDYANMARAALVLYEAEGRPDDLERAEAWVATAEGHYRDDDGGGYFLGADDTDDVIARAKPVADNAVPPGNGVMVEVLARLYHLTGKVAYRRRAEETVGALCPDTPEALIGLSSLLNGHDFLVRAVQVVIVGDDNDHAKRLWRAAREAAPVNRVIVVARPGGGLPATHPAAGKGQLDGRPTAYVCVGPVCDSPITDPDALKVRLSNL